MKLRGYQTDLIADIRNAMAAGHKNICAVLGCGGGKSIIEASIAKSATEKNNRVLFLVHRRELCDQIRRTFSDVGVDFQHCHIVMIQTVAHRLAEEPSPSMIITDECHHCLSATYRKVYDFFPKAYRVGFTATPIRMNEGGLGDVFSKIVEGPTTKWLIDNKFLAPYEYYSVPLADTSGLHVKHGEYDQREAAELMEESKIYGDTVKTYLKIAQGKQAIVYCASVRASIDTAKEFTDAGIQSYHLDGKTPKIERESVVEMFRQGKIQVLCNVDLFGEGFDVPDCECVILLRPTKSLTLHIQQSMRSMRYKPGKTAIIIDHVRNVFRHGFPDDVHMWSLKTKKRKEENKVRVKECPNCFNCLPINAVRCPRCGYDFTDEIENQQRSEMERIEAELVKLDKTNMYKTAPYRMYETLGSFDELLLFGKARGYKQGWAIRKAVERGLKMPPKYQYIAERFIL